MECISDARTKTLPMIVRTAYSERIVLKHASARITECANNRVRDDGRSGSGSCSCALGRSGATCDIECGISWTSAASMPISAFSFGEGLDNLLSNDTPPSFGPIERKRPLNPTLGRRCRTPRASGDSDYPPIGAPNDRGWLDSPVATSLAGVPPASPCALGDSTPQSPASERRS